MPADSNKVYSRQYYQDYMTELRHHIEQIQWSKKVLLAALIPALVYSWLIFQHGSAGLALFFMVLAFIVAGVAVASAADALQAEQQGNLYFYLLGIVVPYANLYFLSRIYSHYASAITALRNADNKTFLKILALKDSPPPEVSVAPRPVRPTNVQALDFVAPDMAALRTSSTAARTAHATRAEPESMVFDFSDTGTQPGTNHMTDRSLSHETIASNSHPHDAHPAQRADLGRVLPYLRQTFAAEDWLDRSYSAENDIIVHAEGFDDASQPINRVLHGGLIVFFVLDKGDTLSYINEGERQASGLTHAQLQQTAIDNLYALTKGSQPPIVLQLLQLKAGVHQIRLDHNFDASILLLDQVWNHNDIRLHTPNGIVAAIPSRDTLYYCDVGSPESIAHLQYYVAQAQSVATHAISQTLYLRKNHRWQPYTLQATLSGSPKTFNQFTLPYLYQVRSAVDWMHDYPDVPISVTVDGKTYIGKILQGGFCMLYGVPTQPEGSYVTETAFNASALSRTELDEIAWANLYELSGAGLPGINLSLLTHGDTHIVSLASDNHSVSSLILLDRLWDEDVKALTPNGAIVVIPSLDSLAFCDADSFVGIEQLKAYAQKHVANTGSGFSTQLFKRVNQHWTPYEPPWDILSSTAH